MGGGCRLRQTGDLEATLRQEVSGKLRIEEGIARAKLETHGVFG